MDTTHCDSPPDDDYIISQQREPLDYSPSSGAVDPEHAAQDESVGTQVGRHAYTPNATFIDGELDAVSDRWRTLNDANRRLTDDDDEDNRGTAQDRQDYVNETASWGRRIGLTDVEIEMASQLVLDADTGYMNNHGSETVVLAALTLAANAAPEHRPCQQKALRPDTVFSDQTPELRNMYVEVRDGLGVDPSGVRACRKHLRQFL